MIGTFLRWMLWALLGYVVLALAACLSQDFFLFPGRRTTNGQRAVGVSNDYEQVQFQVGEIGMAYGLYRHYGDARGVVLVFLDERECVANALSVMEGLAGIGMESLCVDYPGYGGSLGKPTATNLRALAHASYLHLTGAREFDSRRIWVAGTGLGSGPACHVAARWPVAGLILLAPFTSFKALVGTRYPWLPVRLLMRHEFDNDAELGAIRVPTLFIWSQDDRVVPAAMSERLVQSAAGPAARLALPSGGHQAARIEPDNTVARAIDDFIRGH